MGCGINDISACIAHGNNLAVCAVSVGPAQMDEAPADGIFIRTYRYAVKTQVNIDPRQYCRACIAHRRGLLSFL